MCIGRKVPSPTMGGYGMGGVLELVKRNKGWGYYPVVLSLTVKLAMPILNRSLAAVSSVLNSRISRLVVSPCPLYWSSY